MARFLTILIEDIPIRAELFDTEATGALYEAAPFSSEAQVRGEGVYFRTPLMLAARCNFWGRALDDVKALVNVGEGAMVHVTRED